MLNKIMLMGRFTKDPELRNTLTGKNVTVFSLACERDFKANGETVTDFLNCVAWGTKGEFIARYFKKGDLICIVGSVQTRKYELEGQQRTSTEINVTDVYFCERKKDSEEKEDVPAFTDFADDDNLPF